MNPRDTRRSFPLLCPMTICSVSVLSKSYVFDPRPRLPFRIAAKRYWIEERPDGIGRDNFSKTCQWEDVLTLVLTSGNGAQKEHWEPTIQRLFENQKTAPQRTVRFHDMWSLDMPNQGDSAMLNEETLRSGYDICKILMFFTVMNINSIVCSLMGTPCSKRSCVLSGARYWCGR